MKGTIRQRLTVTVVLVSALTLVLLVSGFNLSLRSSLDGDADRLLDARAQAALESVSVQGGRVSVGESPDEGAPDSLVWVFSGNKAIETPRVGAELDDLARSLAGKGGGRAEDAATDTRLNALPIKEAGRQVGTVVSGVSLEPYEASASRALKASLILAGIMLVLIGVSTRIAVDRALRPVARMTSEAAAWSEHDLDRRFNESEPNDELTRLASTFDLMLDRMAHMLRHERNFTAEISHELRTPLAAISTEAELALNRERGSDEYRAALDRIHHRSLELNRILETLLEVARAESGSGAAEKCDVSAVVDSLLDSVASRAAAYGVEVRPPAGGRGIEAQLTEQTLERIVSPVLENALVFAAGSVTIRIDSTVREVIITVSDDGPGIDASESERVFEQGVRGSAQRNQAAPSGTGLGLPLARRLARAVGGEVKAGGGESRGVIVSLPAALDRDGH